MYTPTLSSSLVFSQLFFLLQYCIARAEQTLKSHRFRQLLLGVLVDLYDAKLPTSDRDILRKEGGAIAHIVFLTGGSNRVAELLHSFLFPEIFDPEHDEVDLIQMINLIWSENSFI